VACLIMGTRRVHSMYENPDVSQVQGRRLAATAKALDLLLTYENDTPLLPMAILMRIRGQGRQAKGIRYRR
jgi:hypothetical protein